MIYYTIPLSSCQSFLTKRYDFSVLHNFRQISRYFLRKANVKTGNLRKIHIFRECAARVSSGFCRNSSRKIAQMQMVLYSPLMYMEERCVPS